MAVDHSTRAENAPEPLLDSRTGARGQLGLQFTMAYVSHRLRCNSRASGPRAAPVASRSGACVVDRGVTGQATPTRPPHPPEHHTRRNTRHTVLSSPKKVDRA
jgi:hypothetical protein